jgi:outer membrane lipoprotein-sorting protein
MLSNQLKRLSIVLVVFVSVSLIPVFAQKPMTIKSEGNDLKAKAMLDKAKKHYESYAWDGTFKLEIKLAEQTKPEIQTGKYYQQGEKYRAEMGKDFIVSDGKLVWTKRDNTVRITNATDNSKSGSIMSPKDLIKIYEKSDYTYGITGERTENWSKKATVITFKPNNRRSEYTKIEFAIDQKTNYVVSVKFFDRDQSHSKFNLDPPIIKTVQDATLFSFDKSKYAHIKVEDMRED